MKQERFTEQAREAIAASQQMATQLHHNQWDVEHVMLALLLQHQGLVGEILKSLEVDAEAARNEVEAALQKTPKVAYEAGQLYATPRIAQMMKVVGEEGTSVLDYIDYLKGEFLDFVYLQQNAFDQVDESTNRERQEYIFSFIYNNILQVQFDFTEKEKALKFFQALRQLCRGWNSALWKNDEFKKTEQEIQSIIEKARKAEDNA